jgi:hypothetical protein
MAAELTVGTRIDHDKYGEGVVSKVKLTTYEVFFARGGKVEISKSSKDYEIIERPETAVSSSTGGPDIDIDAVEKVITYVLDKYGALQEEVPMGSRWIDGTMILKPLNPAHQPKEIPIEAFFHKIVMLRDRLRVLEQNINSNERLNDEEKLNLQQYITRIYGSLTTFNILFSEKEHQFVGTGGK